MANEIIKPHKFEVAKNNIYSLSKTVPNVSLQKFPTEGSIFPWNKHNINGDEVNKLLVSPLQSTLMEQNLTIKSLFDIADEVYKALESLDKEYIEGIIAAVMSAKTASDQAKEASRKAFDASTKATTAQADIKRTIEALQATVRILKEFKEKTTKDLSSIASMHTEVTSVNSKIQSIKNEINDFAASAKEIKDIQSFLSSLTHIKEIDQIWTDLTSSREVVKGLNNTLTPFMHEVNQATSRIDTDIEDLKQYRTMLETYQHLGDVDAMWNDVEEHKTNLEDFHKQVDAFVEKVNQATSRIDTDIEDLKQYRTMLETYQHLGDVDAIWSDVEEHKINLEDFHKQVDAFVEKVNQATSRIDTDIEDLKQYRTMLETYQHLGDVDAMWNDVEEHKTNLEDFHKQVDDFIRKTRSEHARIYDLIHQMEADNDFTRKQYNKKIKIAYWISGSAAGLTIINYILQIIGIL